MKKILFLSSFIPSLTFCQDCKPIVSEDKFTGKITVKTPVECSIDLCHFIFIKSINKEDTSYYLYITDNVNYGNYRAKGVYLIFDDGEKWVKEEQPIDVSYISGNTYRYSTFLPIGKNQVSRITGHKIKAARLHSNEIDVGNQDNFICAAKKVINE